MGIYISNYGDSFVMFRYGYDGFKGTYDDWEEKYNDRFVVPKDELFDTMAEIDQWCLDTFEECARFEID